MIDYGLSKLVLMLIQLSFSTIYTFLDEIVRMVDSEYII